MGAAATAAYAGSATAAMPGHSHAHHKPRHEDVLKATNECTDTGRRCIAHCLVSFVEGDTELALGGADRLRFRDLRVDLIRAWVTPEAIWADIVLRGDANLEIVPRI